MGNCFLDTRYIQSNLNFLYGIIDAGFYEPVLRQRVFPRHLAERHLAEQFRTPMTRSSAGGGA